MRIILLIALGAAACDRPSAESVVEPIAHDAALDATAGRFSDLEAKVEELEDRVRAVESEKASLEAEVENLRSRDDWDTKAIERLYENDRKFSERLGIPFVEGA